MSSMIGENIKLSVFGESHGQGIGCVIDGLPAGIRLDMDAIYSEMARRAPGRDKTSTPRLEKDIPSILSGTVDGVTTGAPLAMFIENSNTKSGDYSNIMTVPRPSHSDYPAYVKYNGFNDIRGGGHFSGRLTAPIVFAGAIAKQVLREKGITIGARIKQIGNVIDKNVDYNGITAEFIKSLTGKAFATLTDEAEKNMRDVIENARMSKDSVGGKIECYAIGLPVGVGANIFDTVESRLSSILFGIPAVKGVEFGIGFDFAEKRASEVNDEYEIKNDKVSLISNNNGGVLGGMTNGAPIVVSVAVKPTPSIAQKQRSVDLTTMQNVELEINGRHDPCIVPRAVPVVEAAVALGILDLIL